MSVLDSQLITNGDSQVSIFNYDNGDLLISLDLMKNYGVNLTTFEFEEVDILIKINQLNEIIKLKFFLELSLYGVSR